MYSMCTSGELFSAWALQIPGRSCALLRCLNSVTLMELLSHCRDGNKRDAERWTVQCCVCWGPVS